MALTIAELALLFDLHASIRTLVSKENSLTSQRRLISPSERAKYPGNDFFNFSPIHYSRPLTFVERQFFRGSRLSRIKQVTRNLSRLLFLRCPLECIGTLTKIRVSRALSAV